MKGKKLIIQHLTSQILITIIFEVDKLKTNLFRIVFNKNSTFARIKLLDNGQFTCRGYFQPGVVDESHIPQLPDVVVGHTPADTHFNR